jgi:hypothetical protein
MRTKHFRLMIVLLALLTINVHPAAGFAATRIVVWGGHFSAETNVPGSLTNDPFFHRLGLQQ